MRRSFGVPCVGGSMPRRRVPQAWTAFGAEGSAPSATTADDYLRVAKEATPLVKSLITDDTTATEDVEVLRAKIRNYKGMKRKLPWLAWWYDNEIRKMEAKLRAAKVARADERSWFIMGQTVTATGVFVGGATILALVSLARYLERGNRSTRKAS